MCLLSHITLSFGSPPMSTSSQHTRKAGKPLIERVPSKSGANADDIPDSEKWRIINETGLLKQIPTGTGKAKRRKPREEPELEPERWEYIFQAIFLGIPFSLLYAVFDVVVKVQYREEWTGLGILSKSFQSFPALLVLIYITNRHKTTKLLQALMGVASTLCGCFLLYTVTKLSSLGQMQQAPGLATIWVYLVVQLDLTPAVISLAIALLYYYFGLTSVGTRPVGK